MSDDSTVVGGVFLESLATDASAGGTKPAALVVMAGELVGTIFDLERDEVSVGRSDEADIVLAFAGVSRRHLRLKAADGTFVVQDTGSKNGTFVNGGRILRAVALNKDDTIRLGPVLLKYIPQGDPERLAYDKLSQRTRIDRFTGCYDKTYFNELMEREVSKSKATGCELSLVMFDLDRFKSLNDRHGHDAGDFVLKTLATLIQANGVRKRDVLARYGGEEFVILLPETDIGSAVEIAERLRYRVQEHHFDYDGQHLPVTVSVGVAAFGKSVVTGTALFRQADSALYDAKRAGRNRVCAHGG